MELLVVTVIVLLVSAAVLGTFAYSLGERRVINAAALVQAALVVARDRAAATGAPAGIRFEPDPSAPMPRLPDGRLDPSAPLACVGWVPLSPAPDYSEGRASIVPGPLPAGFTLPAPALLLEQAPRDSAGVLLAPTNWWWNVRVGDRLRLNGSGRWYTVAGPLAIGPGDGNVELYTNAGPIGNASTLDRGAGPVEYLLLVDGLDDDGDGLVDEGFDGLDNDDNGSVDDLAEWEAERWEPALAGGVLAYPYTIRRRPAPYAGGEAGKLPPGIVLDLTTWSTSRERSRCPVDAYSGRVELLVNPDGSIARPSIYSTPASLPMDASYLHLWLTDTGDVHAPAAGPPHLPMPEGTPGAPPAADASAPRLIGERRLITIHSRSGRVSISPIEDFDAADVNVPFRRARRGG